MMKKVVIETDYPFHISERYSVPLEVEDESLVKDFIKKYGFKTNISERKQE